MRAASSLSAATAALGAWPAAWRIGRPSGRPAARRLPAQSSTACVAATLPEPDHHAEACAPEGALYVDGLLFGHADTR